MLTRFTQVPSKRRGFPFHTGAGAEDSLVRVCLVVRVWALFQVSVVTPPLCPPGKLYSQSYLRLLEFSFEKEDAVGPGSPWWWGVTSVLPIPGWGELELCYECYSSHCKCLARKCCKEMNSTGCWNGQKKMLGFFFSFLSFLQTSKKALNFFTSFNFVKQKFKPAQI